MTDRNLECILNGSKHFGFDVNAEDGEIERYCWLGKNTNCVFNKPEIIVVQDMYSCGSYKKVVCTKCLYIKNMTKMQEDYLSGKGDTKDLSDKSTSID